MSDLKILTREGVDVDGVRVRPLARVYSQHWRLKLMEAVGPLFEDAGLPLTDGNGMPDFETVEKFTRRIIVDMPDAVSMLVARWLYYQDATGKSLEILRDDDAVELKCLELGEVLTEEQEQAIMAQLLKYCFPLARLQELLGAARFLHANSTTETDSETSSTA